MGGAEMPERFRCARSTGAEGYHGGLAQAPGQGQQLLRGLEHGAVGDLSDDEDIRHGDPSLDKLLALDELLGAEVPGEPGTSVALVRDQFAAATRRACCGR